MMTYPTRFALCSGNGKAIHKLVSFDNALIGAGISNYNLLKVSSILPIACKRVDKVDKRLGSALLCAYGAISSNELGKTIASAVGVGIPQNCEDVGVIMEFSGYCDASEAERIVREMTLEAMKNHKIECKEVLCSSAEAFVCDENYQTVISALAMW